MLVCNLSQFTPELAISRQASSKFFVAGSYLHNAFAAFELANESDIVKHARNTTNALNDASTSFRNLAELVRQKYSWIADETRGIDFDAVARDADVALDSQVVQDLVSMLIQGKIVDVLVQFAAQLNNNSEQVAGIADRVAAGSPSWDHEFQAAHSLLQNWRELLLKGQFVSLVCWMAARAPAR